MKKGRNKDTEDEADDMAISNGNAMYARSGGGEGAMPVSQTPMINLPDDRPVTGGDVLALMRALDVSAEDFRYVMGISEAVWSQFLSRPKEPVRNVTHALLTRYYVKHPDKFPRHPDPDPQELFDLMTQMDDRVTRKNLAVWLGKESVSSHRWLTTHRRMSTPVRRLAQILKEGIEEDRKKRRKSNFREFVRFVKQEADARDAGDIYKMRRWPEVDRKKRGRK